MSYSCAVCELVKVHVAIASVDSSDTASKINLKHVSESEIISDPERLVRAELLSTAFLLCHRDS